MKQNKILNPIKTNNQKIHRLEMLNLSDSVSMVNIISLLNPKNIVLINGDANDNNLFIVLITFVVVFLTFEFRKIC